MIDLGDTTRCARSDVAPPVAMGTAVRLVGQHAAHLRIDLDQMAEALEAERRDGSDR